ncbi:MAG: hypothetical protein GY822_20835 [Deltaproteobacteria bacterium]|nr:hypothetical protein [Deltaproteobacteria bacterium]
MTLSHKCSLGAACETNVQNTTSSKLPHLPRPRPDPGESTQRKNLLVGLITAIFVVTGCARSGTDDVAVLEESLTTTNDAVAANSTVANDNADAIDALDGVE